MKITVGAAIAKYLFAKTDEQVTRLHVALAAIHCKVHLSLGAEGYEQKAYLCGGFNQVVEGDVVEHGKFFAKPYAAGCGQGIVNAESAYG